MSSKEKPPHLKEGRFRDKVVLVTGSARGIGKNIARSFGREGARLVIADIDKNRGKATETELRRQGVSAEFLYVDLSQAGAPQTMVRQVAQQHGRLDILLNNARSGQRTTLLDENEVNWEKEVSVTLRAAFFASQEAVRVMSPAGGGNIVNISSVSAQMIGIESPAYHIAKAGLLQMTRYLAVHAGHFGVRVYAVQPGFIVQDEHQTRYQEDDNRRYREIAAFGHPLGHVGRSDDVANAVLFLCSQEASFITGQCLIVDGGLILQEQSSLIYQFDRSGR